MACLMGVEVRLSLCGQGYHLIHLAALSVTPYRIPFSIAMINHHDQYQLQEEGVYSDLWVQREGP